MFLIFQIRHSSIEMLKYHITVSLHSSSVNITLKLQTTLQLIIMYSLPFPKPQGIKKGKDKTI